MDASLAVVLLNVLSYFEPLRQLIKNGISEGYIHISSEDIIIFVDGPESQSDHGNFDWGKAAVEAIKGWKANHRPLFNWELRKDGKESTQGSLDAT